MRLGWLGLEVGSWSPPSVTCVDHDHIATTSPAPAQRDVRCTPTCSSCQNRDRDSEQNVERNSRNHCGRESLVSEPSAVALARELPDEEKRSEDDRGDGRKKMGAAELSTGNSRKENF